MKMCEHDCHAICDYCIYFNDTNVIEVGDGYCKKKKVAMSLLGTCDDFQCVNYKEKEEIL